MMRDGGVLPLDTFAHFYGLGLALGIGLLVGVERGWQERNLETQQRVAGIRTFALIGLLGGVWGVLFPIVGAIPMAAMALAFSGALTAFEWRENERNGTLSATDLIAGLVTFSLGTLAVLGNKAAAAAAGVTVVGLLALRHQLHSFLRRLSWSELRSALLLLAMTFIALPIWPDRPIDPWGSLNPYKQWLITVAIAALCFVGYVAVRLAGARRGLLLAGAAGGLVSSTAVTLTYARLAETDPEIAYEAGVAIVASWIISLIRMTVLATALAPVLLLPLLPAVGAAVLVLAVTVFLLDRTARNAPAEPQLKLSNPLELGLALRFGALLGLVMVLSKLFSDKIGEISLLPLAAVSGFADVDPITLSVSQMVGKGASLQIAALAILIAAATNGITKLSLAASLAPAKVGRIMGGAGAAAILAGGAVFLLLPA
jgi:uncharacterized membrane protein (DUF4010 family)